MEIDNDKNSNNAKEAETKKFYDVHCHAFNWSHINVLLFLKRFKIKLLLFAGPLVWLYNIVRPSTKRRFQNLLSLMENDTGSYFLLTEYFLKNKEMVVSPNNTFTIGDVTFKKIVLTPLIQDFDYKNMKQLDIFYNRPPRKPIREQVIDMFNGIKTYCKYKLVEVKNGDRLEYSPDDKHSKLFEIYPFLGLNTRHYKHEQLEEMLNNKYFKDYEGKQQTLYENMGKFNGNIDDIGSNFFAGIKVYPPLGFDPWPDDNDEREKVIILYDCCIKKGIPITTHCSNGGFKAESKENVKNFTAPGIKWKKVLEEYPELKINFAHFGLQSNFLLFFRRTEWRNSIIKLISEYPNVYADISDLSLSNPGCKYLEDLIERNSNNHKLKDRILFGTDFLISLIWTNSYNESFNSFKETNYLKSHKENFCSNNPEKFLFNR